MNLFLFAFLFLSQTFDVVPIIGKLSAPGTRRDGVGEDARFRGISAMWNVGPDLYIFDFGAIRKLNLQTREVSTVTLRAGTDLRDLWSDGTYLYGTDVGAERIRRILLRTGEVEDFVSGGSVPWGLTVEGNNLFVANARTQEILRIDRSTRQSQTFVHLSPPIDPSNCIIG